MSKSDSDLLLYSLNQQDMRYLARNKVLFYEHCERAGLPTIPVICRIGGSPDALGPDVEQVRNADRLAQLLESAPPRLFAKAIAGTYGGGAFLITREHDGFRFDGRTGTAADLFAHIENACDAQTGYVLQPQIRPHTAMRPFASKDGLPTIRVVTMMTDDGPEVLLACLKIPVGASITDNFAHGTSGNLLAAIDTQDGTLTPASGSRRHDWPVMMQVDAHPDSGSRITGAKLPFWEEIAEIALRAQRSLPGFTTVGWDVAATTEGIVLVEANATYDMDILQIAHQRGLKAEWTAKLNATID
jgi:hypothetical protein